MADPVRVAFENWAHDNLPSEIYEAVGQRGWAEVADLAPAMVRELCGRAFEAGIEVGLDTPR